MSLDQIRRNVDACRICADRFAATKTAHAPRPVTWFNGQPRILICGQAPGQRVHNSGRPFDDPSGDRLREWMGVSPDTFYDRSRIAIVPMAFCFPGYDAKGADLPPPKICAATWHEKLFAALPKVELTLLVGGYAQRWHLQHRDGVTQTVQDWRSYGARLPLPHPSWRNTSWIKQNPWFTKELLPDLKARVQEALGHD